MTPRHITVLDVFRDLRIEPEPRATWAVGAAVRDIYAAETGQLPPKGLRSKTFGHGSHCFALYPPEWRPVIERQILAHTTTQQRQGDLLAPATQAQWPPPYEGQNTTFIWWLNSPPIDANREARSLDRRLVVEPETEEAERQRRLRALEDWITEERRRAADAARAREMDDWLASEIWRAGHPVLTRLAPAMDESGWMLKMIGGALVGVGMLPGQTWLVAATGAALFTLGQALRIAARAARKWR